MAQARPVGSMAARTRWRGNKVAGSTVGRFMAQGNKVLDPMAARSKAPTSKEAAPTVELRTVRRRERHKAALSRSIRRTAARADPRRVAVRAIKQDPRDEPTSDPGISQAVARLGGSPLDREASKAEHSPAASTTQDTANRAQQRTAARSMDRRAPAAGSKERLSLEVSPVGASEEAPKAAERTVASQYSTDTATTNR